MMTACAMRSLGASGRFPTELVPRLINPGWSSGGQSGGIPLEIGLYLKRRMRDRGFTLALFGELIRSHLLFSAPRRSPHREFRCGCLSALGWNPPTSSSRCCSTEAFPATATTSTALWISPTPMHGRQHTRPSTSGRSRGFGKQPRKIISLLAPMLFAESDVHPLCGDGSVTVK